MLAISPYRAQEILTGRKEVFEPQAIKSVLRFSPKRSESEFDALNGKHSLTSIRPFRYGYVTLNG